MGFPLTPTSMTCQRRSIIYL